MCFVKIENIKGDTLMGSIVDIEVSGTAAVPDCDAVQVTLDCQGFPSQKMAKVNPVTGDWQATFTTQDAALANCSCEKQVTIHAQCFKTLAAPEIVPGCFADFVGQLDCEPACPDINWMVSQADADCKPDGTRNVTVGAIVKNSSLPIIEAQLKWVEGNVVIAKPPPSNNGTVTLGPVVFAFPSGQQTLHVTVLKPSGCGGSDLPITVDPCGPVGACCRMSGAGAMVCEEITETECLAKGGKYLGDATKCGPDVCGDDKTPPPPPGGGGPGDCGDGLIWAAALTLAIGILALALHCVPPVPVIQMAIFVGGIVSILLSGLLLLIWKLISLFTKCKANLCQAAKIFVLVLSMAGVIMAVLAFILPICSNFAPFPCVAPCIWLIPAGSILSGFIAAWAAILKGSCP